MEPIKENERLVDYKSDTGNIFVTRKPTGTTRRRNPSRVELYAQNFCLLDKDDASSSQKIIHVDRNHQNKHSKLDFIVKLFMKSE